MRQRGTVSYGSLLLTLLSLDLISHQVKNLSKYRLEPAGLLFEPLQEKTCLQIYVTRLDSNRSAQLQKLARVVCNIVSVIHLNGMITCNEKERFQCRCRTCGDSSSYDARDNMNAKRSNNSKNNNSNINNNYYYYCYQYYY